MIESGGLVELQKQYHGLGAGTESFESEDQCFFGTCEFHEEQRFLTDG